MMQYSSMASKSTIAETSFPSAGFESSAGLEINSSYSCRSCVHKSKINYKSLAHSKKKKKRPSFWPGNSCSLQCLQKKRQSA